MNSLTLKSLLAAGLLAAAAAGASAQELKIGYVNSDRVLRDAVPAKAAQAKLEAEFSKREKDLTDLGNRLKVASDRLDKDAPTLGRVRAHAATARARRPGPRAAEEAPRVPGRPEPAQERRARQRGREDEPRHQADLRDEKYDLILQEAVFWSPKVDITDKVIRALNAQGGK
jgi:outer membrane protein